MQTQANSFGRNDAIIKQITIVLAILIPIAGLALMIYTGFYNRYWGDDWCYNFDFKTLGIDGTLKTYFMTGPEALRGYANNRYSLTLISGLLYLMGIFGAKITAALVIISWLTGLFWVFSNLSKIFKIQSKAVILLGAATLLYYTLYISPQRFQVLYWTAGIHYSLSIISGIYLAGLITYQIAHENRSKIVDYLTIPVGLIAGGFSETGCAFLLSGILLLLAATWYWKRKQTAWAIKAYPTTLIAFLSLAASLLILVSAPSNIARTDFISAERTDLLTTLLYSFRFSFDFMLDSVRSLPAPHLIFMLGFFSLSILSGVASNEKQPDLLWKTALSIFAVTIIIWLIISAVQAPSVYFYGAPPDPRGKSLARFTLLAGLAFIAWLGGQTVNSMWNNKWLVTLAILGIAISTIYTARTVAKTYSELPGFITRAQLWDAREADIQNDLAQGLTKLEVSVIDMKGLEVQDIMKSKEMNGDWIISCSSKYYGVEAIKAVQR